MARFESEVPGHFILTDGLSEDFAPSKFFATQQELDQANEHARMATDGNMWWKPEFPRSHGTAALYRVA